MFKFKTKYRLIYYGLRHPQNLGILGMASLYIYDAQARHCSLTTFCTKTHLFVSGIFSVFRTVVSFHPLQLELSKLGSNELAYIFTLWNTYKTPETVIDLDFYYLVFEHIFKTSGIHPALGGCCLCEIASAPVSYAAPDNYWRLL